MSQKFVGVDYAKDDDIGVLVEGHYLDGVFFLDKEYRLKKFQKDELHIHDFSATDGRFDYCILCGERQLH